MKTFIIAELSGNHNGSLSVAKETMQAIKASGADAVKLQTYRADTITLNSTKDDFKVKDGGLWDGRTAYDLYDKAHTPWEWHEELFSYAKSLGLVCFSSPFDKSSVDFLERLECPMYKIASPEIVDIPLIEYVASKQKPIIFSTGIATLSDIELAIDTCHKMKNFDITLLKCTSAYPTPMDEVNLRTIPILKEMFGVKIGLSDHTLGSTVPIASVALGVEMIEKHFILDKSIGGEDSAFSMDAREFTQMVSAVRDTELALGRGVYTLSKTAIKSRNFIRSLYVTKDIKKGEIFTEDNIGSVRPGYGLPPKYFKDILGKSASCDIEFASPLSWGKINMA